MIFLAWRASFEVAIFHSTGGATQPLPGNAVTDFFSVFSGKNRFWHRQFNDKPEGGSVLKRENSVAYRLVVKLKSVTALPAGAD